MRRPCGCDNFKAHEATNTVINMHDQITGAKALGLGQEIIRAALFLGAADQPVP